MEVKVKVTRMFFDRQAIIDAIGKEQATILGKAGRKVQVSAKKLLQFVPLPKRPRKVKNRQLNFQRMMAYRAAKRAVSSQPGQVPRIHRKQYPNLSSVVYAYDPSTKGVVVGPIERTRRSMTRPGPDVMEHGGSVTVNVKSRSGKIHPMRANYRPRPLMGPALQAVKSELPAVLSGVLGPA